MKRLKSKKAQELVEFLLVAPFLVIMLGVLTEYAYALNINMTLNQGLKTATASIYSTIKPGMTSSTIETNVLKDLTSYMQSNNAPTNSENKLRVGYVVEGQTVIFMARYTYIPAFTLPNVYFKIMPEQFDFLATTSVPSAFLNPNNYDTSITSEKLDGIWSASSFSNLDSYNGSENGIMKSNDSNNGRSKILFLIPDKTTATNYHLVHWNGNVDKCILDSNTGIISGTECGSYAGQNLMKYLKASENSYYNIFFLHDSDLKDLDINTTALSDYWAYTSSGTSVQVSTSTDISDTNTDGILKRALALIDLATNESLGNYDNADISSYFSDTAAKSNANTYIIKTFGSMVFVGTADDSDAINSITKESQPISYSYNF